MGAGHGAHHKIHKMAYAEAQSRFEDGELKAVTKAFHAMNSASKTDQATLDRYLSYSASNILHSSTNSFQGSLKFLFEKFFYAIATHPQTFSLEDLVVTVATVCKGGLQSQSELCYYLVADKETGAADEARLVAGLGALHEAALEVLSVWLLPLQVPAGASRADPAARQAALQSFVAEGLDDRRPRVWQWADVRDFCSRNPHVAELAAHLLWRALCPSAKPPASLSVLPRVALAMSRLGTSQLLTDAHSAALKDALPASLWPASMVLLYSSTQHGFSLTTMLTRVHRKATRRVLEEPSLLLVRDETGAVFGAFASVLWRRLASNFYGDERCFVFQLQPAVRVYRATGQNRNFLRSDERGDGIAIGADGLLFALAIDADFAEGRSQISGTFSNPSLSGSDPFRVQVVELWGFVAPENMSALHSPADDDAVDEEGNKKTKSVLDNKQNTFILDLLGKNYSESVRDS